MKSLSNNAAAFAALTGAMWVSHATPTMADVKDYEFQLVQKEAKKSDGAVIAVRLIDKRSGKAVPNAVIISKRLDMAPDSMPEMTSRIEQLSSTEPGIYRFKTMLTMEGGWRISLGAKVQGETGTLESQLVLKATK